MAWIKMRTDLADDPIVIGIAADLNLDIDTVVGKLFRFWAWADEQTTNGRAPNVTAAWLDARFGAENFSKSLERNKWLIIESDGIRIPKFSRYNGYTLKTRALTAKRVAKHRAKKITRYITQLEKEKEKDINSPPLPADGLTCNPTVEDVVQAGIRIMLPATECEKFHAHYAARGWCIGTTRISNWQQALTKWKLTQGDFKKANTHGQNTTPLGNRGTPADSRRLERAARECPENLQL